jgi:hypothetical protein
MSDVYAPNVVRTEPVDVARAPSLVDWRAIFGGAMIAAGVSLTLFAFGSGVGLSVASTAPTWRDSSPWLWLLSGLFLIFVALCSFGFGGYAAGRLRAPTRVAASAETEMRDGMSGLIMWGLAVLLTAVLALGAASTASRQTAPSGGTAGASASVAGETALASELDELFRTDRYIVDPTIEYQRSVAARVLLKSSSHTGVPAEDRAYLTTLVRTHTGISAPDADDRVNRVMAESKDELHHARAAAVMQAFLLAAALLVGAAAAWFAAAEGGRDRERGTIPVWNWSLHNRRP